ncbi:hypothetical protein CAPNMURICA_25 [Arthrobacter phage CapnMurica]|uniref:Uncharacterized protein n=2 Tax=Gordonvirus captnmurica TaxID=1982153 RepID=A0A386KNQ1_9CAUD|nr:hypothetical protein FDH68_gp25 [Arthrobacter phage CaptnMurica]ALY08625.1 hypothetical protein CAPNMURICA_25 [Arthrobacter phage CaptnMurica]AYD87238.1 hypothetical protein SEA_TENNO_26 [Arthrobacter phage Tenno]
MPKISFSSKGSFSKTEKFLSAMSRGDMFSALEGFGREGVAALAAATPTESGATAGAWGFKVSKSSSRATIEWTNSHIVNGVPIAVILQYGHGTGTGGYVQGRDYINPAIKPVFDKIADKAWKVVTSA